MAEVDDREIFRRRATNARLWLESGDNLLAAADTVWEKISPVFRMELRTDAVDRVAIRHYPPYYLLAGSAVESFIKALRAKQLYPRTGEFASTMMPDPQLPPGFKTHNLVKLAAVAKIEPLASEEADLLKRLSDYVVWAGRYPIATSPGRPAANYVAKDDHDKVHLFVKRVRVAYNALPWQPSRLDGSY